MELCDCAKHTQTVWLMQLLLLPCDDALEQLPLTQSGP